MISLYLDTSFEVQIGLLDKDFNWIDFKKIREKKVSKLLQETILDILQSNDLTINDVDFIFQCSGPGSYTGMRLSEGLVQVLEWLGVEAYSFYHFNIPSILGTDSYQWISSAFKGEYFIFDSDSNDSISLKKMTDFKFDSSIDLYTHDTSVFEKEYKSTADLIYSHSKEVFKNIFENKNRESIYYYRKEEDEFKLKEKQS